MGLFGSKKARNSEQESLLKQNGNVETEDEFVKRQEEGFIRGDYKPVSTLKLYKFASTGDRAMIFFGVLFSLFNGCLQPISSIITGSIVNVLLENEIHYSSAQVMFEKAKPEIIAFLIVGIAILICAFLQSILWHTSAERQIRRIRNKLFWAVMRQDITWFDQNQSGSLTTLLTDNIDRMKEGMGDKVGVSIQAFAQFVVGFLIAIIYSWKMTLVMLAVMPLVIFFVIIFNRRAAKASKKERANYAVAGGIAEEVLMNVRTVLSFNAQSRESRRYEERLELGKRMGIRISILVAAVQGTFFFLLFSSFGLAFWYGSTLMSSGEIRPGDIFTVFIAVMSGSGSAGMIAPQIVLFITAKSSAAAVYDIIDRVPTIDSYSSDGLRPETSAGTIRFNDVSFAYPNRNIKVIDGITLEAKSGETVALVGHSGCGKSTIFNLILRFYDPTSGSITLDGTTLTKLNLKWLRNVIAVVSQEPILFNTTVEENLRMGNENIRREDLEEICKIANAHDFIMDLPMNYGTLIGDGGIQLSGGQKQRIAIARALTRNPRILLLDEATSALDVDNESIVQEALDKAARGRTTFVIAHRLATIRNAGKIIVLQNGTIVQVGTHSELITDESGVYKQLVDSQSFEDVESMTPYHKKPSMKKSVSMMPHAIYEQGSLDYVSSEESDAVSKMSRSEVRSRKVSRKLSRSMSRVNKKADRLKEELAEEGVSRASWINIVAEAKKELPILMIAVLFSIIRGLMLPIFSIAFGRLFVTFSITDPEKMSIAAIFNSVLFVVLGLIQGLSAFISVSLYGTVGERLTMRLRVAVFNNFLRQDISFFDDIRHTPTKLTTRLATDVPNVKSAIDQRMAVIVQGCVSLVSGLFIAFYYGWQMSLVVLVLYIFLAGMQIVINRILHKRDRRDIAYAEEAGKIAIESIENPLTVQALTRQMFLYNRFKNAMKKTYRSQMLKIQLQAFVYGLASSLPMFISSLAYGFGSYLVTLGHMIPSDVYQVITSINMSTMGVMNMATFLPELMNARMAAGLVFSLKNLRPKIDIENELGLRNSLTGDIALKDLYFAYPNRADRVIIQGLSASIAPGKTLALVGPSGCGKSTIISLLNRFYDPTDGRLEIDALDIRAFHLKSLRKQMATVGQEPVLFNCSIWENISYGTNESNKSVIEEAAKLANIHDDIIKMPEGYDTVVGERGARLSGGQKQRIAIARAVVRQPKILLLDEATSALDSESEKIVQAALDLAACGRTCIVVAHRLSTIQKADHIVVLKNGRVVESGSHRDLLEQNGLYCSMVMKQSLL